MEPDLNNQQASPPPAARGGVSTRNKIGIAVGVIAAWLAISGLYVILLLVTEDDTGAGELGMAAIRTVSGGAV